MGVSYDYSLKVFNLSKDSVFPVIDFPGLSYANFSLIPYTVENIHNVRSRHSTISVVRNYKDSVALENAFLFAEGFNDTGLCFDMDELVKPNVLVKHSFRTVFSSFPGVTSYSCGQYVAYKCAQYQSNREKPDKITPTKTGYNYSIAVQRDYLEHISLIGKDYFEPRVIPREDVIDLFRRNSQEEDFIFLLPLIERFAILINQGKNPYYLFPLFIALNEFIEHASNDEYFVDYFSNIDNAKTVSEQYNNLKIKKYSHTKDIINSMILPHRFLNDKNISSSSIRKTISEQKKSIIKIIVSLTVPLPDNTNTSDNVMNKRIRKLFDTVKMIDDFGIKMNENAQKTVLTDMKNPNTYYYRTNNIKNYFNDYLTRENATDKAIEVINYLMKNSHYEICYEIIDLIQNNNAIGIHHLAVISYVTCMPRSVKEYSSARVLLMIKYALSKTDNNIDFVCDVLVQLLLNFATYDFSYNDWKTIIDFHDSGLNPRQIVNILIIETQEVKIEPHSNHILDKVIDLYSNVRKPI